MVTTEPDEVGLDGGRRVENLVKDFDTPLTNFNDLSTASKISVTATYADDETTVTVVGSSGDALIRFAGNNGSSYAAEEGHSYTVSALIAGTGSSIGKSVFVMSEASGDTHTQEPATLTADYQLIEFQRPAKTLANPEYVYLGLRAGAATLVEGEQVLVKEIQYEDTSGKASKVASSHVSNDDHGCGVNGVKLYSTTNGNTVLNNVVTEAPGTAITPVPQVLMQPQRTNLPTGHRPHQESCCLRSHPQATGQH